MEYMCIDKTGEQVKNGQVRSVCCTGKDIPVNWR